MKQDKLTVDNNPAAVAAGVLSDGLSGDQTRHFGEDFEECGVYEDTTDRISVYIYFCGMPGSPNAIEDASESMMAPSVFNRTPRLRMIRLA